MALFALVNSQYNKISLISETSLYAKDTVEVYKNNVKIGVFTTISPLPADAFDKTLAFDSTITSYGIRYIFFFTPEDIDQEVNFEDGVYHFIILEQDAAPLEAFGVISDRSLQCCFSTYLKNKDTSCSCEYSCELVKSYSYLIAAKASMNITDVETAVAFFNKATCLNCTSCE